jgi:hypothetical protein
VTGLRKAGFFQDEQIAATGARQRAQADPAAGKLVWVWPTLSAAIDQKKKACRSARLILIKIASDATVIDLCHHLQTRAP